MTTESAEVYTYTETSLKIESKSPNYLLMLEPNMNGSVMFTLGRHAFTSTYRAKDLAFGVEISGYKHGEKVKPVFNLDDTYQNVLIEGNMLKFQEIYGPIPVFFNTVVDSVKLIFSNSYGIDVHQYLSIDDLKIMEDSEINENPLLMDCNRHSIMIGIDGSASMDKTERKTISKQLMYFFKKPPESLDSNAVCIMSFGKQVHAVAESVKEKEIIKNIKGYKRGKEGPKKKTGYTNWSAAFDQAIERQPDIFIFITDRWSNYGENGPASFNAQYQMLIEKCNLLKSGGTRLLFITSGLNTNSDENSTLYAMLNEHNTQEIIGVDLSQNIDLKEVDLITMEGFDSFERINLSSLLICGENEEFAHIPPLSTVETLDQMDD